MDVPNLLAIPLRTIQDWRKKIDNEIDITKIQSGRGRKPVIPGDKKQNIKRTTRRKP